MKVLIASFSVSGAMGDNFKMVAEDLSKYVDVSILTNYGIDIDNISEDRVTRIRFDRKHKMDYINPISYMKIFRVLKRSIYDVVFIYSPHPVNIFMFYLLKGKSVVPFVHDHIMHSGVKGVNKYVMNKVNQYTYKKSTKIIVSCNYIKEDILRRKIMEDSNRICVNYLGLLDNLKFPIIDIEEDIDVLFFGRIEYYKGIDDLVKVSKMLPQYKFCILGRGNLDVIYSTTLFLPNNCMRIDKYIPDEELSVYIQRAKIVVLPYKDATGTQVIPSVFYYSKPIVATNVGCFSEYIGDGVAGLIVPQGDLSAMAKTIDYLISNPPKRIEMGNNGRKKLDSVFSKEVITHNYIDIFKSVL